MDAIERWQELQRLRDAIKRKRKYVVGNGHAHAMIGSTLITIERKFGKAELKKTIKNFKLAELGFREEK